VDGNDLAAMNDAERTKLRRHKIGFVFQRFNLLPTLDARGTSPSHSISTGTASTRHRSRWSRNAWAHRPLAAQAGELSGGEQQRVAIARAIINEPKIILADEPTGNLDTKNSEIVLSMLRQLKQGAGPNIVMITHNPEAAAYSDALSTCATASSSTECQPTDMRTLWRGIVRVVFWSYERGTWQYDIAVAGITLFVLFSPLLIHFNDQPLSGRHLASSDRAALHVGRPNRHLSRGCAPARLAHSNARTRTRSSRNRAENVADLHQAASKSSASSPIRGEGDTARTTMFRLSPEPRFPKPLS